VKRSKAQIRANFHRLPELRFEQQQLTPFSGLVLIQALFQRLRWKERLQRCFAHLNPGAIFGHHTIFSWLVVHLLLGFRRLRDRDYYAEDPLVQRLLGVRSLPDVSTISRSLKAADAQAVERVRGQLRALVLQRLEDAALGTVTVDFDGSIQSTRGHPQGSAVGFNPRHKGARGYYPLFATVAQTEQFLDLLHRPGNVHDLRGAREFALACLDAVRQRLPRARLESRFDAAFFDQKILFALHDQRVEFTASVPFERLVELKRCVEERRHWHSIDPEWSYFEPRWKPKSWPRQLRFLVYRHLVPERRAQPLQLDLFEPVDPVAEYKVVVTNKRQSARAILLFHNGRGRQEAIFGEAKSCAQLDYLPVRTLAGNQLYSLAALFAHNLGKELQMQAAEPERPTTETRASRWSMLSLRTLRHRFLLRAGRLTHPGHRVTLTLNANPIVEAGLVRYLEAQIA
jgi:hypothetical protein